MKYVFVIFLFCSPFTSQAQTPISKETKGMMAEMMFTMNRNVLIPDTCIYEVINYDESNYFGELGTGNDIDECVKLIESTGSLGFAKDWKRLFLFFKADITEHFQNNTKRKIGTKLIEYNLKNSKGEVIKLADNNIGNSSGSEIEHKTQIGFEDVSMDGITGTAKYGIEFLTGYDRITLSEEDIGKEFTLDDCQYKLLDIIDNILIIETKCEKRSNLKVVNFTSDSKVFDNYSWAKLSEMSTEDKSIQIEGCFGSATQTVSKPFYEMLSNNPKINLDKFIELIDESFFDKERQKTKVVTIRSVAFFENEFLIYTPIYETKEVEVKY